jgi:hypothetical protein
MKNTVTVNHFNFGNVYHFDTLPEAKAWTIKACFDATIAVMGERVATFSSITGWHDVVLPIDDQMAAFLDREEAIWIAREQITEARVS